MRFAQHHRLNACFFLFAVGLGALLSRMPDLQVALDVDKSGLGLTLIGMALGALTSLTLSSPLISRFGARITAFVTVIGTAAIYALIPWLPSAPVVFVAFYCAGLLAGALEINLNVEIGKEEARTGRSIMNRAHGFWSLGFFVTALCASFVRQGGMSMHLHVGLAFGVVLVAGGWVISGLRDTTSRNAAEFENTQHFAFPTMSLLPLCIIGIAAFLVEGAGIDWSAIYMRDVFAVEPFIGGLGLTLFTFFMAMVRLFVDPLVDRYGARLVCIVLLVLSAAGLTAVWLAPNSIVALFGFALMGGGCSAVYPLAVSAAARRTDQSAHLNVAALGQVTFIVFFLAPPLLGFVAEHLGIRNAYFICLPLVIGALLSVKALSSEKKLGYGAKEGSGATANQRCR